MPYFPPLPPPPPALVRLAQVQPATADSGVLARDLETQASAQAADLSGAVNDSDLRPRDKAVPLGGPIQAGEEVFLDADVQQYDQETRVFTARGKVRMRLRSILLTSDEMRVDLATRIAVAEGNIKLIQGDQVLVGTRLEYNFARSEGVLFNARGTINTKTLSKEPSTPLPTDVANVPLVPEYPRTEGGLLRFQAERLVFGPDGWQGDQVRVTPDQFDPPEFELRSPKATVRRETADSSRLNIEAGTLVFDGTTNFPFPFYTNTIDSRRRRAPNEVGFDSFDKGGLYYQQNFDVIVTKTIDWTISPQLYLQQAFDGRGVLDPSNFGLQTKLLVEHGGGQVTRLFGELNGIVLDSLENRIRLRVEHVVPVGDHRATFSYGYRERYFNGILGFQNVTQNYGVTIDSPVYNLGTSGVRLSYQGSASMIKATSDRAALGSRPELARYRVVAAVSKSFPLLVAQPTPTTRENLRYSPYPVTPGLWLDVGTTLTQSWYSSGDSQSFLVGGIGLRAILGQFSRDILDYTSLNIGFSQGAAGGDGSPFLFDRIGARQQISAGILQQVYGPLRAGVQTYFDPSLGQTIDTYYTVSFDHRTYALSLTINPVRQIAGIQLRIDDFNWNINPGGRPDQVTDVVGGVERFNYNRYTLGSP